MVNSGYIPGRGLGKYNQGITKPIEAVTPRLQGRAGCFILGQKRRTTYLDPVRALHAWGGYQHS